MDLNICCLRINITLISMSSPSNELFMYLKYYSKTDFSVSFQQPYMYMYFIFIFIFTCILFCLNVIMIAFF